MPTPQAGDVLIKGTTENGFELFDAVSLAHIAGPFQAFAVAVVAARIRQPRAIWQQSER